MDARASFGPSAAPPSGTLPTFLRLPRSSDLAGVELAVVGLPFDSLEGEDAASTAPAAIRDRSLSLASHYNPAQRVEVVPRLTAVDCGDVEATTGDEAGGLEAAVRRLAAIHDAGAVPLGLGGGQEVTPAGLRAAAQRHGPLALVLFDAHLDDGGALAGPGFAHAGVVRAAVAEGSIDPRRSTLLGVRGGLKEPGAYEELRELGLALFTGDELAQLGSGAVAAAVDRAAGKTYLSFDLDVVDPAFAPGVRWPVAGGPTSAQALALVRACRGLDLAGADVVGLVPDRDPSGVAATLAATLAWEIVTLVACMKTGGAS